MTSIRGPDYFQEISNSDGLTCGRHIQVPRQVVLFDFFCFMKFCQFFAFVHESIVLGDGVGVQCVDASLFHRADCGH